MLGTVNYLCHKAQASWLMPLFLDLMTRLWAWTEASTAGTPLLSLCIPEMEHGENLCNDRLQKLRVYSAVAVGRPSYLLTATKWNHKEEARRKAINSRQKGTHHLYLFQSFTLPFPSLLENTNVETGNDQGMWPERSQPQCSTSWEPLLHQFET